MTFNVFFIFQISFIGTNNEEIKVYIFNHIHKKKTYIQYGIYYWRSICMCFMTFVQVF